MHFAFHKLHSLGNDFVIILAEPGLEPFSAQQLQQIADRHRGVGFDQLMWVMPAAEGSAADFNVRIYNSDGGESGQCVNGMRSVGYLLQQLVDPDKSEWLLHAGGIDYSVMQTGEHEYGLLVNQPVLDANVQVLLAEGRTVAVGHVDVGNPHAVMRVDDMTTDDASHTAQLIAQSSVFPNGVNVGVCQILSDDHLALRVLERGAGWTEACGSGAVAAASIAKINQWVNSSAITISQPGGDVKVSWPGDGLAVSICGPIVWVYNGEWCGN